MGCVNGRCVASNDHTATIAYSGTQYVTHSGRNRLCLLLKLRAHVEFTHNSLKGELLQFFFFFVLRHEWQHISGSTNVQNLVEIALTEVLCPGWVPCREFPMNGNSGHGGRNMSFRVLHWSTNTENPSHLARGHTHTLQCTETRLAPLKSTGFDAKWSRFEKATQPLIWDPVCTEAVFIHTTPSRRTWTLRSAPKQRSRRGFVQTCNLCASTPESRAHSPPLSWCWSTATLARDVAAWREATTRTPMCREDASAAPTWRRLVACAVNGRHFVACAEQIL